MTHRFRAILCSTYFLLLLTSYYILKPVREALFLELHGWEKLPQVHLLVMFVTYAAALIYSRVARGGRCRPLVLATNGALGILLLVFWALLVGPCSSGPGRATLAWLFYIWVAVFAVFVVTAMWTIASRLFDAVESGRWYGVIGAGGISGAIVGGVLTRTLALPLGVERLLLVSAGILCVATAVGLRLAGVADDSPRFDEQTSALDPAPGGDPPGGTGRASTMRLFLTDPYVGAMGLLVLLYQTIGVTIDNHTYRIVSRELTQTPERAAYFGTMFSTANVLGLFLNLVVARPVQTRWGPGPGLILLPLVVLCGAGAIVVWPTLTTACFYSALSFGVHYSIQQSSKEMLYVPTTPQVKMVAKGFIDTFLFRVGDGVGAVWLLAAPVGGSGDALSARNAAMALLMIVVSSYLAREYQVRARD